LKWKAGRLENWGVGELEGWKAERLKIFPFFQSSKNIHIL